MSVRSYIGSATANKEQGFFLGGAFDPPWNLVVYLLGSFAYTVRLI